MVRAGPTGFVLGTFFFFSFGIKVLEGGKCACRGSLLAGTVTRPREAGTCGDSLGASVPGPAPGPAGLPMTWAVPSVPPHCGSHANL